MPWTAAELEEMRRADEEIERDFALTQDDLDRSRALDRDAVLQGLDHKMAHIAAQQRAYREANRDKVAAQQRAYREVNRAKRAQKNPPADNADKGEG
jgi:hypothetical protein